MICINDFTSLWKQIAECKILSSQSGVAENSGHLGCKTVSFGDMVPDVSQITVASSSRFGLLDP